MHPSLRGAAAGTQAGTTTVPSPPVAVKLQGGQLLILGGVEGAGARGAGLRVRLPRPHNLALRRLARHAQLLGQHQQRRLGGLPHGAVVPRLVLDACVVAQRARLGQRLRGGAGGARGRSGPGVWQRRNSRTAVVSHQLPTGLPSPAPGPARPKLAPSPRLRPAHTSRLRSKPASPSTAPPSGS